MSARKFTDEQLLALHAQGLTDRQIGEQVGASGSSVSSRRAKLGLSSNFDPTAERTKAKKAKPSAAQPWTRRRRVRLIRATWERVCDRMTNGPL